MVFNPQMGLTDVWTDIDFYKEERYHPTQKPLTLIQRLIMASSNEDMVVLDPFLGAGSTSIAAKMLNRKFIGIELDENYCNIAKQRLHNVNQSLFD
jgi:adenine-specific DNA-methyltransferase